MTEAEWQNELMSDDRMVTIVKEMSKWRRTPYYISSLKGNTAEASVFNQFATWALPIVNTTLSNINEVIKTTKARGAKEGLTSEEAISLGKTVAVMGTMWMIALAIRALDPTDDDERNLWFYVTREMNTLVGAFQVVWDLEGRAPALQQLYDLTELIGQIFSGERYKRDGEGYGIGDLKWKKSMVDFIEPTFVGDARQLITGTPEREDTRERLILEAIKDGEFKPEEIAEFLNPVDWNNEQSNPRTEKEQEEYRQRRVQDLTMEYNVMKKYPDSQVVEIILAGDKNSKKVEKLLQLEEAEGEEKVYNQIKEIYKDKRLCGNQERKTVCPISDQLFKDYREARKQNQ
jgi:hypothetical protein